MKRIIYILFILPVILNCSHSVSLIKISNENRLKLLALPLKDLTGNYDVVEPKMELLIENESKRNFIEYFYEGPYTSYDQINLITNHFDIDYFNKVNKLDSIITTNPNKYHGIITGTVEQIQYGSPKEIAKYIVDSWLWGIVGLAYRESYEQGNRSALVEYNFKIFELPSKSKIASFAIQGTARHWKFVREKIVEKANKRAAYTFIYKLCKDISKHYGLEPIEYYKSGNKYFL